MDIIVSEFVNLLMIVHKTINYGVSDFKSTIHDMLFLCTAHCQGGVWSKVPIW